MIDRISVALSHPQKNLELSHSWERVEKTVS
jgi:hypothetical protein